MKKLKIPKISWKQTNKLFFIKTKDSGEKDWNEVRRTVFVRSKKKEMEILNQGKVKEVCNGRS